MSCGGGPVEVAAICNEKEDSGISFRESVKHSQVFETIEKMKTEKFSSHDGIRQTQI